MVCSAISAANKQRGGYAPCARQWVSWVRGGWRLGDFSGRARRSGAAWSSGSGSISGYVSWVRVSWSAEGRGNARLRVASLLIANFRTAIGTPPSSPVEPIAGRGGLPPFGRAVPRDGGRDRATGNLRNRRPDAAKGAPSRPFRLESQNPGQKSKVQSLKTGSGARGRAQSLADAAETGAIGRNEAGAGDDGGCCAIGGETPTLGTGKSRVN